MLLHGEEREANSYTTAEEIFRLWLNETSHYRVYMNLRLENILRQMSIVYILLI
jgi:hypothetical protein